jgi:hypothetical protein
MLTTRVLPEPSKYKAEAGASSSPPPKGPTVPTPPDGDAPLPPDADADIQAVLAELPPRPSEEAIEAILKDPTFAGIVARQTKRLERLLTPQGMDHAKRTMAAFFLMNPHASSLLSATRDAEASLAQPKPGAAPAKAKPARAK